MSNPINGPIRPEDVAGVKCAHIPGVVFQAFNAEIALRFSGKSATVYQKDVMNHLNKIYTENQIFDSGWLNVEEAYEHCGWDVTYDKPGYNESYGASYKFEVKKS